MAFSQASLRRLEALTCSRNRHTESSGHGQCASLSNPSQDLRLATLGVERCAVLPHDRVEAPVKLNPGMVAIFVDRESKISIFRSENVSPIVMP